MYEYKLISAIIQNNEEFNEWINSYMHDGWRVRSVDFFFRDTSRRMEVVLERRVKSDGTYTNKHKK